MEPAQHSFSCLCLIKTHVFNFSHPICVCPVPPKLYTHKTAFVSMCFCCCCNYRIHRYIFALFLATINWFIASIKIMNFNGIIYFYIIINGNFNELLCYFTAKMDKLKLKRTQQQQSRTTRQRHKRNNKNNSSKREIP